MDPPDPFTTSGNHPSPIRRSAELQGPRPSPLKVNKDSHKIKKPPIPPHPHPHPHPLLHHHHHQPPLPPPHPTTNNPQPIIIYSVSPKVIHTTVSDFMHLVQSLTGPSTTTTSTSTSSGNLSPAARLASIENTTPSPKETQKTHFNNINANNNEYDEISRILDETNNYFPTGSSSYNNNIPASILSPAPAMLPPPSPPGLFSPVGATADPLLNMFIPSPTTLFSVPMVSPSPSSSYHYYNSIFDF